MLRLPIYLLAAIGAIYLGQEIRLFIDEARDERADARNWNEA